MAIPAPSEVKKFAREDINTAVARVRDELEMDIEVNNLIFETEVCDQELKENGGDYDHALTVGVIAELHSGEDYSNVTMYEWEYFIGDDDVFYGGFDSMVDGIKAQLEEDGYIESSITASTRITAADEFG